MANLFQFEGKTLSSSMIKSLEDFRSECKFTFITTGQFVDLKIHHPASKLSIEGSTYGSQFKLQAQLLKELWEKWKDRQ